MSEPTQMDAYEQSKCRTKRYHKLKKLLRKVYGYDNFRIRQYEVINKIINGEDVCAVFSTGHGKSICFQIPALYLNKPAIIVSPLISLMNDQRLILDDLGITSCCYNSQVADKYQMRKDILKGKYKFIYITPESVIKMNDFLIQLEDIQGISLFAIDEAHCISAYGFNFRKDYRGLTFLRETLPEVPILALTATATTVVARDICKVLDLKTEIPITTSYDRPNLYIEIGRKKKNPVDDIKPILTKHSNKSIIIYCLTKKETEKIAEILKVLKLKYGVYHAGLDAADNMETHLKFMNGTIKIVVATIAFGMGINKSDVRVVIHYGAPRNIEGYYQEIGRAGRDGKNAYCYAFYNFRDFQIQKSFIHNGENEAYQKVQLKLLAQMEKFVTSTGCRRQILLNYFGEDLEHDKCDFCDNCCGTHQTAAPSQTSQNVQKEAKLLIDLIESISNRSFGLGMYVNILRGSANKSITSQMKKSRFYGRGKHKSMEWWKELSENLLKLGYLQQIYLKGGRFAMQVIKVTQQGLTWANMADFTDLLGGVDIKKLDPIMMSSAV